jgi:hypothetical protein
MMVQAIERRRREVENSKVRHCNPKAAHPARDIQAWQILVGKA